MPVGGAVQHQQNFAAGLGDAFDRLRTPDVLAHRQAQPHAAEIHRAWHRPGREHALLVEHAVVRQVDLVAQRDDGAAVEQDRCVVELAVVGPGRADHQRRALHRRLARELFDRRAAGSLECRLEHQVFGRITGNVQFGEYDQIGALAGCFDARAAHLLRVAGNIADRGIELRDGNRELIGRTCVHGKKVYRLPSRPAISGPSAGMTAMPNKAKGRRPPASGPPGRTAPS